ncbi:MAG: ankyrin repeat domain-containing protein, partial [Candidatus Latescibacteria bacterium]|nr:ankyrin repeat domain-containing protein [Candidatus Latescibacterota bacterium]
MKFESLFSACKNGDISVVKACFAKPSVIDVDDANIKGSTALHVASEAGHEIIVQYLLEAEKANINCRDNRKYTPLIN